MECTCRAFLVLRQHIAESAENANKLYFDSIAGNTEKWNELPEESWSSNALTELLKNLAAEI